jgi:hypothetical protein
MISKRPCVSAVLLCLLFAVGAASAQTAKQATPAPAATADSGAPQPVPLTSANCPGGSCDYQQPRITIATPAPAPAPWTLPERILWVAILLLVVIAYAGILIALSLMRKIERQARYAETAADAAAEAAKAMLQFAETQTRAQEQARRPWLLVTAAPVPGAADSFNVLVSNRGRTPARILSLADEIVMAKDESQLPEVPVYRGAPRPPQAPIFLLPGESMSIRSFRRDDVHSVCRDEEQVHQLEEWTAKLYIYGKVTYAGLYAPDNDAAYETSWCCWYIHGRKKSGLVLAGPAAYHQHT